MQGVQSELVVLQSQATLHNRLAHNNMDGSKMKSTTDIKISEEFYTLFGTYNTNLQRLVQCLFK